MFSPYYTNLYVTTPSPCLYFNYGYTPPPHNPYSSYSSSHYSCYYNNYHQALPPTKISSTIKRDFAKHLQVSHLSFKKISQKSLNPFQFTIKERPPDLFSFLLQTKTLKSPFSFKLRTNHIHGNYFSQTLTTSALPNDDGGFPHQPQQQPSECNFVNHPNRINDTTVSKPSDPFTVSTDPLWKFANKARRGVILFSIFGEEEESLKRMTAT
ncbi:unnamed protein product [Vicia faba]|uniref:Uncharacterized protein n=1 Tax=Vicia faba TaxID=3906 RepID=A0AAV0YWS6_VICFA|nr:unnamed protein product [Vicia faba]